MNLYKGALMHQSEQLLPSVLSFCICEVTTLALGLWWVVVCSFIMLFILIFNTSIYNLSPTVIFTFGVSRPFWSVVVRRLLTFLLRQGGHLYRLGMDIGTMYAPNQEGRERQQQVLSSRSKPKTIEFDSRWSSIIHNFQNFEMRMST